MTDTTPGLDRHQLEIAFSVLTSSVKAASHSGHVPRASEVRLEMKRQTYDGFDPARLGFKRFRDFLASAQEAGRILIRERPGDVEVLLPHEADLSTSSEGTRRIKRSLWRAFVDWNPDNLHYLDLQTERVLEIPKRPVELEPDRFAQLRQRVAAGDPSVVEIPSIPVGEQIKWMRQFAEEVGDTSLSTLLLGALASDKPTKNFTSIVRADPIVRTRWNKFFGERVLASVTAWHENDPRLAEFDVHQSESAGDTSPEPQTQAVDANAARHFIEAASRIASKSGAGDASYALGRSRFRLSATIRSEQRLRALVHRAVDRMSEDELRGLRLPVGALLDED